LSAVEALDFVIEQGKASLEGFGNFGCFVSFPERSCTIWFGLV
jgi:hypothetical protein